ncbi:MAG TPA: hypothetical protein DER23_08275 [Clostridiales bacterium]|nr:hypothetical protein [Clostridiales bacterium]
MNVRNKMRCPKLINRYTYLLFSFVYFEVLFRLACMESIFKGFWFPLLCAVLTATSVFLLTDLFKKRTGLVVTTLLLAVIAIFYVSQIIYYSIFGVFFSFASVSMAGDAITGFFKSTLLGIFRATPYILLYALIPWGYYFLSKKVFLKRKLLRYNRSFETTCFLVIEFMIFLVLLPCVRDTTSSYSAYFNQEDPYEMGYYSLGVIRSLETDVLRSIIPEKDVTDALEDDKGKGKVDDADSGVVKPKPGNDQDNDPDKQVPIEYGYNVTEIDFDKLIASAGKDSVKSLHEYFSSQQPTQKNAYTGMCEGYNLIYIVAESFHLASLHEEVTPTLYKMAHEGFYFTEFYNPIWNTSTSDGEFAACTGLFPSGSHSFRSSGSKNMYLCLGNTLKRYGYTTNAYHNHTYSYYERNITHPNMGYTYQGVGNGLEKRMEKIRWTNSDLEMIQITIDPFLTQDAPFHNYYMTVSGHLHYNWGGNAMARKNKNEVAHLNLTTDTGDDFPLAYLATQVELDKAMEYLLRKLEEAGVADKTLIVISGDHYPYGLDQNGPDKYAYLEELVGYKINNDRDLFRSALIMYVPGMKPVTVTKPCSSVDILPTVYNLMGIEYDSRILSGQDILSNSSPLVVFKDNSFITSVGYYSKTDKLFTLNKDVTVTDEFNQEEYIKTIGAIVSAKRSAASKIIDLNYYHILYGK